jgi:ribosome maturation factor RimP
MVVKKYIEAMILEAISGTEVFLVEVAVNPGNIIRVFVDEPGGISLDEIGRISKAIESGIDSEKEDFEMQVSSPGLNNPLVVIQQYKKNIGKELKIETNDKQRLIGDLLEVDPEEITINAKVKVKVKGSKKNKVEFQMMKLKFENIKIAKVNLHFKG